MLLLAGILPNNVFANKFANNVLFDGFRSRWAFVDVYSFPRIDPGEVSWAIWKPGAPHLEVPPSEVARRPEHPGQVPPTNTYKCSPNT